MDHYENMFGDGHNLSFTSLMQMPLDESGGGNAGGHFVGWDTPQAGQSTFNMSRNWGLPNTFDGPWGNTFNGKINVMNQMDPMVVNDSMSAMVPKLNGDDMVAAMDVANTIKVGKFPEVPIVSEVAVDAGVDVATASKVSTGAEATIVITPNVQEKRMHKPTTRGEIMLLTTKDAPVNLPEWFSISRTYLEDGLDIKEWKDCVETWANMENALGLSEVGSVRSLMT